MDPSPTFVLTILKGAARPVEARDRMVIVLGRRYAYLAEEISRAFAGQERVHVIVDRRRGERRRRREPVAVDNRKADRRKPREEIVEVALTT